MATMSGSKGLSVPDGKKPTYLLVPLVAAKNMVGVGDVPNGVSVLGSVKGKLSELVSRHVSVPVLSVAEISNVLDTFEYELATY